MTDFQRAFMPWAQLPVEGLVDMLNRLAWKKSGSHSAARDVAGLMVYVVMLFVRSERTRPVPAVDSVDETSLAFILAPAKEHVAEVSYDELQHATGLSRSLVHQGIERLIELGRIRAEGSNQKRAYVLAWPSGHWTKLPCRAIAGKNGVRAFQTFSLRSRHELNALKLYLYLASVRDRSLLYSEASYEKIFERTGISERDIRKAINLLTTSGLLARVDRETDRLVSKWGPNKYYLTGYSDLMVSSVSK